MAGKQKQTQVVNQGESPSVVLRGFTGLSLKIDFVNRPSNSFQSLDNMDLYVPGSIRKVVATEFFNGSYPGAIYNLTEYLAQPNGPQGGIRRLIGAAGDGNLYNITDTTGGTTFVVYGATAGLGGVPPTIPFMLQYSGYYVPFNMRSWSANTFFNANDAVVEFASDGNAYVFAVSQPGTSAHTVLIPGFGNNRYGVPPVWPTQIGASVIDGSVQWTNEGIVNSTRFLANYLALIVPGKQPIRINEWQFDPTSNTEPPKVNVGQMGCSAPQVPINILPGTVTPNLNGYAPAAGRAYAWTLYNPNTLEESALAPFVGQTAIYQSDNASAQTYLNGSVLLPLPPPGSKQPFSSYQSFALAIPTAALVPAVGTGYTKIRIYATKDGGSDFFLVPQLFDGQGGLITGADGAISISLLEANQVANSYFAYVPIPGTQNINPVVLAFEGGGPVNLAPDPQNLGPGSWSEGAGTVIVVTSGTAPDGSNSFTAFGTGSGFAHSTYVSARIKTQVGVTYSFGIYMDNANGTSGTMKAFIRRLDGTALLTLTQPDGGVSTLQGSFVPGAGVVAVQIVVEVSGVSVPLGQSINWSDMALYASPSFPLSTQTNYPTTDDSLVIPAPAPDNNYPPPVAAMAEIWNDALWLVDYNDQTKIWYSQRQQFGQFGKSAYVRSTQSKNADQILEVIKCYDRLLIGKGRSIEQITTYPPGQPVPVDPQHGVAARRSTITYGSSILGWFTHGVGQVRLSASLNEDALAVGMSGELFGDDIKTLLDTVDPTTMGAVNTGAELPCPAIFNSLDLFLLAFKSLPVPGRSVATFNNTILMYYLGRSKGFSTFSAFPNTPNSIITIKEVQIPPIPQRYVGTYQYGGNGSYYLVITTTDGNVYTMFTNTQASGIATGSAVTQPLPTAGDVPEEVLDTDKNFEYLYLEGNDLPNFKWQFAIDQEDQPLSSLVFTPPRSVEPGQNRLPINKRGKTLTILVFHQATTNVTPLITLCKLAYSIIGMRAY